MTTTRALTAALFSLALALVIVGCGSIKEVMPDASGGAGGSAAGGTTGGGVAGVGGTAGAPGTAGAAGSSGGRGGTDAAGRGGQGGTSGAGGASAGRGGTDGPGSAGRGGAAGSSVAGRGGAAGSSAGRGGAAGGNAGAAGSAAGGRGGQGGTAGSGVGGRGGTGGTCGCQAIYQPVCGVDGKTYSNDCEARCANVAVAYQGACADECKTNDDCVHYPEYVGTCCGSCLPTTAPRPPTISCIIPCMQTITCTCVATKCTVMVVGSTTQ